MHLSSDKLLGILTYQRTKVNKNGQKLEKFFVVFGHIQYLLELLLQFCRLQFIRRTRMFSTSQRCCCEFLLELFQRSIILRSLSDIKNFRANYAAGEYHFKCILNSHIYLNNVVGKRRAKKEF